MDLVSGAILGILQGVTEWLPISSSGQGMGAMMTFFGLSAKNAFSLVIYLHLGTLLAVILRFRDDIKEIVRSLPRFREDKLVQFILVSTLFNAMIGIPIYLLMKDLFSSMYGGLAMAIIGALLIATGLVLYASKGRKSGKGLKDVTIIDMAIAGISQGLAILPGISRSGITISALLFTGVRQEDALRLSFLMSIPAVIGANVLEFSGGSIMAFNPLLIIVGILFSFIAGYLSIDLLMRIAHRMRFDLFCVIFGAITIALASVV